ncbi:hypothetical protein ACX0MV_18940 [Pseudomonas borbori]
MISFGRVFLALMFSMVATAATASEENIKYIEFADIVLNLETSPESDDIQGYLLATACETCSPVRIEVDRHTEIFLNGRRTDLEKLALKIDWQGMVFFNSRKPAIATRLLLQ